MILPGFEAASRIAMLGVFILGNVAFPQRFLSADDIPFEYFSERRTIIGRVERVIDGDTLRITHCPTYFSCPEIDSKKLKDTTIKVRAYGIDSPELKKQESDPPSQPFAEEAKQLTSSLTLNKLVEVKLMEKDKYGRVLGKVAVGGTLDLSLELAGRGLATLYTGKGAVYDGNKIILETAQDFARKQHLGIWSLGEDMVSPKEFKRLNQNGNSR